MRRLVRKIRSLAGRPDTQDTMTQAELSAVLQALNHRVVVIDEINHRLADLDKRFEAVRVDAETVTALALSFQRFATLVTERLEELSDELAKAIDRVERATPDR